MDRMLRVTSISSSTIVPVTAAAACQTVKAPNFDIQSLAVFRNKTHISDKHSKSEAAGGGSGEEDWIPELGLRDRGSTKHADQQYRAWVDCTLIDFEIA